MSQPRETLDVRTAHRPTVVIYGDFNCPYSYLTGIRANDLADRGLVEIDWRAVEHDRRMSVTGIDTDLSRAAWRSELDEVAQLAQAGEEAPSSVPAVLSSTKAAVAAYAESVTDGIQRQMRDRLFDAIWVQHRNISSAYEVRRIITDLMYPPVLLERHRSTEIATPVLRDPDPFRAARKLGGTVAPDGGPLTSTGYWRIRGWRDEWLSLPEQVVPTVVDGDGTIHAGISGLSRLSEIGRETRPPVSSTKPAGTHTPALHRTRGDAGERPAA